MSEHLRSAAQIQRLLPAVLRARDDGTLEAYLRPFGEILDGLRETLWQLLRDFTPNESQAWVLPYIAELLDTRLRSPHAPGKRIEVRDAIRWRQRKGTSTAAVEIASGIGNISDVLAREALTSAVLVEGWTRIAMTPRVDMPLPPSDSLGMRSVEPDVALGYAHPSLPAATVDFRRRSRAFATVEESPVSTTTSFCGEEVTWEVPQPHGVPEGYTHELAKWRLWGGRFDDRSRRTADLRTPTWMVGHAHPKRALVFLAPPDGFFSPCGPRAPVSWSDALTPTELLEDEDFEGFELPLGAERRNEAGNIYVLHGERMISGNSVRIEHWFRDGDAAPFRVESLWSYERDGQIFEQLIQRTVRLECNTTTSMDPGGRVWRSFVGRGSTAPHFSGDATFNTIAGHPTEYHLGHLTLDGTLAALGVALHLDNAAIKKVDVTAPTEPVEVRSSLVDVLVGDGATRFRLEYVTVLSQLHCDALDCTDSLLPQNLDITGATGCIRFSAVPPQVQLPQEVQSAGLVRVAPLFWADNFAAFHCAVLHPAASPLVTAGAEDGGELGAYHDRHHCQIREAVAVKLRDFLPVGIEPVVLYDSTWGVPDHAFVTRPTVGRVVEVIEELPTGRNIRFRDTVTGQAMSRENFVRAIRAGHYPDYHIRRINGIDTPATDPDNNPNNNLG